MKNDSHNPFDIWVKYKEKEKIVKYRELKQELKQIWKSHRVTMVSITGLQITAGQRTMSGQK